MDKRKPTYQLTEVKQLVSEGQFKLTMSARETAYSLGFTKKVVRGTLLALEPKNFYKSTTEYVNHTAWQDVYRKTVDDKDLYIKLKITHINGKILLILSFKER